MGNDKDARTCVTHASVWSKSSRSGSEYNVHQCWNSAFLSGVRNVSMRPCKWYGPYEGWRHVDGFFFLLLSFSLLSLVFTQIFIKTTRCLAILFLYQIWSSFFWLLFVLFYILFNWIVFQFHSLKLGWLRIRFHDFL